MYLRPSTYLAYCSNILRGVSEMYIMSLLRPLKQVQGKIGKTAMYQIFNEISKICNMLIPI